MNTLEEKKKLSESLLAACKAAGIEKPKNVAQDLSGAVWHYEDKPDTNNNHGSIWAAFTGENKKLDHPPYADDWQESLLEWVEPQESLSEWRDGFAFTETEKQQIDALAHEPLANVLARHPESFTIETERNEDSEVLAHFVRDHHGDITQMIRVDACDIACDKYMEEPYGDDYDEEIGEFRKIYHRAWSDALTWWDATARQRCEAYLRTLGKWKEGS